MSLSLEEIFQQAKQDPELQITPEYLEAWIKENNFEDNYHYLDNKTFELLQHENHETIHTLQCIPFETRKDYVVRLQGWRVIDDLRDFRRGQYVRFINKRTGKMTKVMIGLDVKFTKNGTNMLTRYMNGGPVALQYKMDDNHAFQKITAEEYMVLLANKYTQTQSQTPQSEPRSETETTEATNQPSS